MNKAKDLYKTIVVSNNNYKILKELGQTADSFNDVISRLLAKSSEGELKGFEAHRAFLTDKPAKKKIPIDRRTS